MVRHCALGAYDVALALVDEVGANETKAVRINRTRKRVRVSAETAHDRGPVCAEVEEVVLGHCVWPCRELPSQVRADEAAGHICTQELVECVDQAIAALAAS